MWVEPYRYGYGYGTCGEANATDNKQPACLSDTEHRPPGTEHRAPSGPCWDPWTRSREIDRLVTCSCSIQRFQRLTAALPFMVMWLSHLRQALP